MAQPADPRSRERSLTIVHVRERDDFAEVMCVESARIYRLPRQHPRYREVLESLIRAATTTRKVVLQLERSEGDIIEGAACLGESDG